jgi:5-methylcytosine-specific restriction endonuclease McrA
MLGWLRNQAEQLFGAGRSGQWARVRRDHLAREPACAACGRTKDLQVHHVTPVHVDKDGELREDNLVTLCSDPCHLVFGHLLSYAKRWNPRVREDCRRYRERLRDFRSSHPGS